jgi:catalase
MKNRRLLLALAALGLASIGSVRADDQPVEIQVVDALNKAFGTHPGFRANHAKGVVVEGSFTASSEAAALSRAVLFNGSAIPVTVRFSDSTGVPNLPDGAPPANPHGMAIKYHLPNGGETDMVINSLKFFPVATGAEFRDYGIDAFVLVNKAGGKQAVRYRMVPEHTVHLDAAEAAKRAPDFLMDDLPERLKRGPVTFHLKAQLAAAGDSTKDPTQAWPEDRKMVELGVLTINKAVANSAEAQKKLIFLPGALTEGIEPSDDPLINVRTGAYAVSFSRRNQ